MNKKKLFTTMIGLVALAFTLSLNYRYASNDYGILENTLSVQVLASGGSSGGASGGDSCDAECRKKKEKENWKCEQKYENIDSRELCGDKWRFSSRIGTMYTCSKKEKGTSIYCKKGFWGTTVDCYDRVTTTDEPKTTNCS